MTYESNSSKMSLTSAITFTVNNKTGLVNGTGGIWGYTAKGEKTPDLADKSFFENLQKTVSKHPNAILFRTVLQDSHLKNNSFYGFFMSKQQGFFLIFHNNLSFCLKCLP